jgi:hypothetical protein
METDARYCDAVIQKFREYCRKNVRLDGTGYSFDEIAQERRESRPYLPSPSAPFLPRRSRRGFGRMVHQTVP